MDSPAILVARFLRANSYNETLAAFLREAGLPPDAGAAASSGELTIEQVLHEKMTFDLALSIEKLGVEEQETGWKRPAPSAASELRYRPPSSNILQTSVEIVQATGDGDKSIPFLVATTADRRLQLIETQSPSFGVFRSTSCLQDSPVLSYLALSRRYFLCACMSGTVVLYDVLCDRVVDSRHDHSKYLVKVIGKKISDKSLVATAGWDGMVLLYEIDLSCGSSPPTIGNPRATLTVPTNPESILFIEHPDSSDLLLLLTRRGSTFIFFYALPDTDSPLSNSTSPPALRLIGRQNLAPHSSAWVAFTPSDMALCPTDHSVVAVATSTVPHMKLIIARLLVPPITPLARTAVDCPEAQQHVLAAAEPQAPHHQTLASQARADLVLQDREDAAILTQCTTMAPQTQYSTPTLAWRPDGSGVWVNSDDGVIRGIEVSTGKVVARLEGHAPGAKIRCLWAGMVEVGVGAGEETRLEEWLVSGGFDQRLIVWKTDE